MYQIICAFMIIFFSTFAFGQANSAEIQFGQIKVLGKHCESENVQFVPSFDGTSFSVLFTDFTVESKKFYEYRMCRILIPVKVPRGQKIEIRNMDLRGFMSVPKGSLGGIGVLPRFLEVNGSSNSSKNWSMKWISGDFEDEFTLHKSFAKPVQSSCQRIQWLEINTYVGQIGFKKRDKSAWVTLDSLDAGGALVGSLKTRACGS